MARQVGDMMQSIYCLFHKMILMILCLILCSISCVSCLSWTETTISSDWVYQAIKSKDLSQLEHRIATFERIGLKSPTVEIAKQWLYTVTCLPNPNENFLSQDDFLSDQASKNNHQSLDPLWQIFVLQLKMETLRKIEAQFLYEQAKMSLDDFWRKIGHQRQWIENPYFFEHFTEALDLSKWSSWPENEEGWPDEIPAQLSIENRCTKTLKQNYQRNWDIQELKWLKFQSFQKIDALLKTTNMPNQSWQDWQWWYFYHQAITYLQWINHEIGWPYEDHTKESKHENGSSPWIDTIKQYLQMSSRWYLYEKSCRIFDQLMTLEKPNEKIQQNSTKNLKDFDLKKAMNTVYYLTGICQLDLSTIKQTQQQSKEKSIRNALAIWENIDLDHLSTDQLSLLQYQKLKYLSEIQDWQACLKLDSFLPLNTSKIYAPFVYHLGQTFERSGQEDRFLSFGMKIFRDKGWRKDPFLRALFYLFVRKLTKFSFEEKVVEILEDLGERSFTYERVLIFSEMALDEGQITQGIQSAQWLLSRHDNAQAKYQYHALLAFAYFLDQKPLAFETHIKEIIGLNLGILDAIPMGRRADFFKPRDMALTHVFRLVLPKIAEMEDLKTRDFWLKKLTVEIQSFLRLRADSKLKSDLLDLYRVASQMLSESQARAYPELIGKSQRPSLVLGEVRLNVLNISPYEPRSLEWESASVWSLMMIPHNQSPESWNQSWMGHQASSNATWMKEFK